MTNLIVGNAFSTRFPSIFNPNVLDEILNDFDKELESALFNIKSDYPYNIVECYDSKKNLTCVLVEYALAGFTKDEVDVKVVSNKLMIHACSKSEADDTLVYRHKGIARRELKATLALWSNIEKTKITSKFENGLLTISLPIKTDDVFNVEVK